MKLFIQLILLVEYLYTKYYYIVIVTWFFHFMYTLDLICCHPHQFLKIRSLNHSFLILQSNSQKLHVLINI